MGSFRLWMTITNSRTWPGACFGRQEAGLSRSSHQRDAPDGSDRSGLLAPRTDPETGLVTTDATQRAVGFGFCDAIYFTGKMLFPSLLRYRAAGELAELCEALGRADRAGECRGIRGHLGEPGACLQRFAADRRLADGGDGSGTGSRTSGERSTRCARGSVGSRGRARPGNGGRRRATPNDCL